MNSPSSYHDRKTRFTFFFRTEPFLVLLVMVMSSENCLDSKYCLRLGNCLSKENGVEGGGVFGNPPQFACFHAVVNILRVTAEVVITVFNRLSAQGIS